jgi:hypothetical protein
METINLGHLALSMLVGPTIMFVFVLIATFLNRSDES